MKHSPLIILAWWLLSLTSCEKEPVYFGDSSIKSVLSIQSITDTFNTDYRGYIATAVTRDTTYVRYFTTPKDTIFQADGKTIKEVRYDTTFYDGKRASYTEIGPLLFPFPANEVSVLIRANCAWSVPSIYTKWDETASWVRNIKVAGIGDAIIKYDVKRAISLTNRKIVRSHYYCSGDSTVLIKVMVTQKRLNEE